MKKSEQTPNVLYRKDDGEIFRKNDDGTYSMDRCMMAVPYKWSYAKLMETKAFSPDKPKRKTRTKRFSNSHE